MRIIATPDFPHLDPVGLPSIAALIVVSILLLLTQRWIVGLPEVVRRIGILLAPWVCLGFFFLMGDSTFPPGRFCPDAENAAAAVISVVFGFAFAVEHFRFSSVLYRAHGSVISFVHGTLLVGVASTWTIRYMRWGWFRIDLVLLTLVVFWVLWLVALLMLNRHVKLKMWREKGCCVHCGYDLRGNVSGVCPECGEAIDPVMRERIGTI